MAPCSKRRPRIAFAPTAMAMTLRPRSLSVLSAARFSFAAAATSPCEMSASKGGLPSTPTSIISVRRPALSMRSRRKENSSPLVSNVPISATVLVIIASAFRQFAGRNHSALRHRAEKRLRARRRIDGNQFQRLPASVHRRVVDVRRNVNHISGADRFPLFAVDIDHLLALSGHDIENLFGSRVIVSRVAFPRLQEHNTHGKALRAGDTRFAEPLDRSPFKDLRFDISGCYETATGELCHACSFSCGLYGCSDS